MFSIQSRSSMTCSRPRACPPPFPLCLVASLPTLVVSQRERCRKKQHHLSTRAQCSPWEIRRVSMLALLHLYENNHPPTDWHPLGPHPFTVDETGSKTRVAHTHTHTHINSAAAEKHKAAKTDFLDSAISQTYHSRPFFFFFLFSPAAKVAYTGGRKAP